MVQKVDPFRDAEALITEREHAEAEGHVTLVTGRILELERVIAFLMDVNYRPAGTDAANALVACLQLRARELRNRHRVRQ